MKNIDRFRDELADIAVNCGHVALVCGVPVSCDDLCGCGKCDFYREDDDAYGHLCSSEAIRWAQKNCDDEAPDYWARICAIHRRQLEKGLEKYGQPLEENTTLSFAQRVEHLEEELIDGLKYCEHLKEVRDSITGNDYQRMAMRTINPGCGDKLENAALGLAGEAGEVADLIKKHLYQGHGLATDKLIGELGDVLWYAALACQVLGVPMEDVMRRNIEKLQARYPEGFDKARSINRKENEG